MFALLGDARRRTIRAPVNPLDKSTIVSIFPRDIEEIKHTISPGRFRIPKGSYENPSILVVGPSSWWREIDEDQPLLEIPNSSIQVADSIVRDYCNGLLGYNDDAMPGIFFIPGELTISEIRAKHKPLLDKAVIRQKNWYEELIKKGGGDWARTNGNPLTISNDMRLAAAELGRDNLDWMKDFNASDMVRCIACGVLRNPSFPVCQACHAVIDKEKAKILGLEFAK